MLWTNRLQRSSEEFWSLTYREIYACIDDYFEEQRAEKREQNIRAGLICATIKNSNPFSKASKFWNWTDFFIDEEAGKSASAASDGTTKLSMETKTRFRQLAAHWQAKREKAAGKK